VRLQRVATSTRAGASLLPSFVAYQVMFIIYFDVGAGPYHSVLGHDPYSHGSGGSYRKCRLFSLFDDYFDVGD
jgi:hypothetical protein